MHARTGGQKRQFAVEILLLACIENLFCGRRVGTGFISLGYCSPISALVVHKCIVAFHLQYFRMYETVSRLHATNDVRILQAYGLYSHPHVANEFVPCHTLMSICVLKSCPESFWMVDDYQRSPILNCLPARQFDVLNCLIHHGGHFASCVVNRSVPIQSPGKLYVFCFRYLTSNVAVKIISKFPAIWVQFPCRSVIDKEINACITGKT